MLTNTRDSALSQAFDPVHAQIEGDNAAQAYGYTANSSSPVLALCRDLIDAGHLPTAPMLVYCGNTLALRISSLQEAAALEINGEGNGFRPRRQPDAASPVNATDGGGR